MSTNERQSSRLTEVELQLMHLEKDFESLNEVVLQQGQKLDELMRSVMRLSDRMNAADDDAGERNMMDEKPPHY